jgi:chromosome segregation ATPase
VTALEARIATLRHQVPFGLTSVFAKLESDMRNLQAVSAAVGCPDSRLGSIDFSEIESKLRARISERFDACRADLSQKIENITQAQKANPFQLSLMNEDDSTEFEARVAALRESIGLQDKKNTQRIATAEAALARLALQPQPNALGAEIEELSTKLRAQQSLITNLRGGVQGVRDSLESSMAKVKKAANEIPEAEIRSGADLVQVPDMSKDLKELREDFTQMSKDFMDQIALIRTQTEQNEKEEREATDLLHNLSASLKGVSEKIREFSIVLKTLSEHADQLATKLTDTRSANDTTLQDLIVRIRTRNSSLATEIQILQSRLSPPPLPSAPPPDEVNFS